MKLEDEPIFIAGKDGSFREHRLDAGNPDEDVTVCGIRWVDLPDNRDSTTGEIWPGDKPWYYDHDRADVTPCAACGVIEVSWKGNT